MEGMGESEEFLLNEGKIFQKFPSSNRFLCWGRFITGPVLYPVPVVLSMILAPCILFLATAGPIIWVAWTPVPVILLSGVLLMTLWSVLRVALMDPGIIPRRPRAKPSATPKATVQWRVDGKMVYMKYCRTCHIYRPPRASHCADCDNCVEMWDHHCVWLGTCIGKRNYKHFLRFLMSMCLLSAVLVVQCVLFFILEGNTVEWYHSMICAVDIVYVIVTIGPVCALLYYHVSLVVEDKTTREQIKNLEGGEDNPCCRSWYTLCCTTWPSHFPSFRANEYPIKPLLMMPDLPREDDEDEVPLPSNPTLRGSTAFSDSMSDSYDSFT